MKLNGVSIAEYGICRNFRIGNLHQGLNLIHGRNGSGKTTLSKFIKNVVNGFQAGESQSGYLEVSQLGVHARISRDANHSHRLIVDNPAYSLRSLETGVPAEAYFIDGRNLPEVARKLATILTTNFHVPVGDDALGNNGMFQKASHSVAILQTKLDGVSNQIAKLESERNVLVQKIDQEENHYQSHRKELENRIHHLTMRIDSIRVDELQVQIDSIDKEIADLRIKIESASAQIEYVSKPYKTSDGLAILYRRLDEIDNQIRRWRTVHTDIQEQRVRLKDEMVLWNELTMDSDDHPYHRSRQLLHDIESSLLHAENSIHDFQHQSSMDSQSASAMAHQLSGHCSKIREDLYALCEELGSQYKTVRHRSAAAEFKRLRRCYHEIGDNIEALVGHRRRILEEIRLLDPAGASAIVRADNDFCSCAQHEGYLQARRKYIGEFEQQQQRVEVVKPDQNFEHGRLVSLQQQRADRVRELVQFENELSSLKAQRKALVAELDQTASFVDISTIRTQLEKIQFEMEARLLERKDILEQLEWNKSIRPQPVNPLLESSSHWIQRLTDGELKFVWIENSMTGNLMLEHRNGEKFQYEQLGSGQQQQVALGICLAIADYQRNVGVDHPVILDDVFVNLDPRLIHSTFESLQHFCERGNQVIAMTSDQTVIELAASRNVASYAIPSFDLPDTSVSPAEPMFDPDRSPGYPKRHDDYFQSRSAMVREYSAPISEQIIHREHEIHGYQNSIRHQSNYNTVPVFNEVNENSELSVLLLRDTELDAFNRAGVYSIAELLDIDLSSGDTEFESISTDQIDFYQSLAWLLICVPALELEDAEILIATGINEPEQLESTHAQQLLDRISRHLSSNSDRTSGRERTYSRESINGWYRSLDQTRSKWRLPSGYSRRNRWRNSRRRSSNRGHADRNSWRERGVLGLNREPARRDRRSRSRLEYGTSNRNDQVEERGSNRKTGTQKSQAADNNNTDLKFYLNQTDDLEAAPSIGPKTAERFIKIGVSTVGDFLAQTAESMASKINYKRITAEVIRQWQHQARLVCRVPHLRGHDAQLLVACGITEPEDLAAKSADNLFGIIQPFAESKDGLKIIRGGKQPDIEEITEWISWAQQTRSLHAA